MVYLAISSHFAAKSESPASERTRETTESSAIGLPCCYSPQQNAALTLEKFDESPRTQSMLPEQTTKPTGLEQEQYERISENLFNSQGRRPKKVLEAANWGNGPFTRIIFREHFPEIANEEITELIYDLLILKS